MDDDKAREILERLARLETKVDAVVAFTGQLQNLLGVWMSGGRGKLLTAIAKGVKGGGT